MNARSIILILKPVKSTVSDKYELFLYVFSVFFCFCKRRVAETFLIYANTN